MIDYCGHLLYYEKLIRLLVQGFVKRLFAGIFFPFFFAWVLIVSIGEQLEPGRASELSKVKVNDCNETTIRGVLTLCSREPSRVPAILQSNDFDSMVL